MFTLEDMLRATGGRVIHGVPNPNERFSGGAFDSRIAERGSVFFALRDRRDGHEFVADALAHGARAAVVYDRALLLREKRTAVLAPR